MRSLEKTWCKTCSDEPNGNWDRTARMMILQLPSESGHPVFRASSAFERGELDSKEHGKKSTQFNENDGSIEMLLRTVISVNQLSIYLALADMCNKMDRNTSADPAEDSSEDSESSGTPLWKRNIRDQTIFQRIFSRQDALTETQQSLRPIRPEHQRRQRQNQQFEGGEKFDYYVDRKTGWRFYREPRGNRQAASSSSISQWPTLQWQTSWSSWQPTSSEKWW